MISSRGLSHTLLVPGTVRAAHRTVTVDGRSTTGAIRLWVSRNHNHRQSFEVETVRCNGQYGRKRLKTANYGSG